MFDFAGKTAVVTGAGSGMGRQVAVDLLAAGANVAMLDLKDEPPDYRPYAGRALYMQGDLTDEAYVAASLKRALASFGGIDHLVNAAGILLFGKDKSVVEIDAAVWERVLAVNLTACARMIRLCVPHMLERPTSSMVHFSTIQCYRGDDKPQDAYQAAKAGLIALSKSVAIQFADKGLRSNVVVPGMVDTPLQARWDADPDARRRVAAFVPLKRIGRPSDLSNATLFLLSELASYVTGTELIVDGGLLARP